MIEPDKIEGWMQQVRDEESFVEDYDFLDQLTHGGPEGNASDGLANIGAYLAIYEEDGEVTVDEELVEELDSRRGEESSGKRFRNIVYDAQSAKREDNTLFDRGVDGHGFLQDLVDDYREEVDHNSLPQDNENTNKDGSQNQISDNPNGGDNMSVFDELVNYAEEIDGETRDQVESYEDLVESFLDDYKKTVEDLEDVSEKAVDTASEVETVKEGLVNYLEGREDVLEQFESRADDYSDRADDALNRMGL